MQFEMLEQQLRQKLINKMVIGGVKNAILNPNHLFLPEKQRSHLYLVLFLVSNKNIIRL